MPASHLASALGASLLVWAACIPAAVAQTAPGAPEFAEVYRLFDEKCTECHTADDPEANLVLETYEGLR